MKRLFVIVLALVLVPVACLRGDEPPAGLPPLREVWLDSRELPSGLGSGSWSIVPRADLLAAYQRARVVADAQQRPPWLIEASVSASTAATPRTPRRRGAKKGSTFFMAVLVISAGDRGY